MKLSISNLAFLDSPLEDVLPQLAELHIQGVEMAPSRLWEDPLGSTIEERVSMKKKIAAHDVSVVGLQSLFYKHPDLQIFAESPCRKKCLQHLLGMVDLCADLGGELIVFGAAGTRKRGDLDLATAQRIARDFFCMAAEHAKTRNIYICFEPLSPVYHCDFVNTIAQGAEFVEAVGHPNLRLLIDTGSMFLNGEDSLEQIHNFIGLTQHIHINDPQLAPAGGKNYQHEKIARVIKEEGYQGWLTMEFLAKGKLAENVAYSAQTYKV